MTHDIPSATIIAILCGATQPIDAPSGREVIKLPTRPDGTSRAQQVHGNGAPTYDGATRPLKYQLAAR